MRALRLPTLILAAMVLLVAVATGNLSGIGIGDITLLYDAIALPRLALTVPLVGAFGRRAGSAGGGGGAFLGRSHGM